MVYGGPEEAAYCEAFAKSLGGGHADAVNSGTNAVYVALMTLELEPGSEVIVPPITDAGGTMPIALGMCIPVPADSARGSLMTSAAQIEAVMTDRTSAIVVAHIGGHPVDMDPILELAAKRGIPILEDCAQAHGTLYKGRPVGTLGAIAAFSTMFGKHHATGSQGGVVFTRNPLLFAKAKQIADRGKCVDGLGCQANLVASLNFNQDELSMAIGRVQFKKQPAAIRARRAFAALIEEGLKDVDGVSLIGDPGYGLSSYFFMMLQLDGEKLRCDSQEFASALRKEGIDGLNAGYSSYPTDQPWHNDGVVFAGSSLPWGLAQQLKPARFDLPNAHQANDMIVRFDVHESLKAREANDLLTATRKVARFYKAA